MPNRPPRRGPAGPNPPAKPPRRRASGGAGFDPYRKWLAIPAARRPPTYYDLLGVARGEDDAETIEAACARRKAAVRPELAGEHTDAARQILYELEEAKLGLLDPAMRAAHDRRHAANRRRRYKPTAAPPRVLAVKTVGDQSEIGRLFGTVVAILAVGCLAIYGVTFGFWDKDAPVVIARDPVDVTAAEKAPARPAPRPARGAPAERAPADPEPEPEPPTLLRLAVVPPTAEVTVDSVADVRLVGAGRDRRIVGDLAAGESAWVSLKATAPGFRPRTDARHVRAPAAGEDAPARRLALPPQSENAPPAGAVDLVHAFDPATNTVKGRARRTAEGLVLEGGGRKFDENLTVVRFPFRPADAYRLTVTVRDAPFFMTGLAGRGGHLGAVDAGADQGETRLKMRRGTSEVLKRWPANLIPNRGRVTVTFDVSPGGFFAKNDRGDALRWAGPWSSLDDKPLAAAELPSSRQLFLAAWDGATVEEALYEPARSAGSSAAPRTRPLPTGLGRAGSGRAVRTVTGRLLGRHRGSSGHLAVARTARGTLAFTGGADGRVFAWDLATGRRAWAFRLPAGGEPGGGGDLAAGAGPVRGLHATADGRSLYVVAKKRVHELSCATGERRRSVRSSEVDGMASEPKTAMTPDGRLLALTAPDGRTEVYDLPAGRRVHREKNLWTPALAAFGDALLLGGWEGGDDRHSAVRAARAAGGGFRFREYRGLRDRTTVVAGSAAAGLVAAAAGPAPDGGASGRQLVVWKAGGGGPLWEARHPDGWAWAAAFTPDGRGLLTGGGGRRDGWLPTAADGRATVHVWDAAAGDRVAALVGGTAGANALAVTPDGAAVATAHDGTVRIWGLPGDLFGDPAPPGAGADPGF